MTLKLSELLQTGRIGDLGIGADEAALALALGPASSPPTRLTRRSKIWTHLHGNVTVLLTDRRVTGIHIDFEGDTAGPVTTDGFAEWDLPRWEAWASERGWEVTRMDEAIHLKGPEATVFIDGGGHLHMVHLRGAAEPGPTR